MIADYALVALDDSFNAWIAANQHDSFPVSRVRESMQQGSAGAHRIAQQDSGSIEPMRLDEIDD